MLTWFDRCRLRAKLLFGRLYTGRLVVGVVIKKDNKYLLIEELRQGKVFLNIPAGHVEPQETPIEAAKREAKEESGLDVTLTGTRALLSNTWKQGTHSVYWIFDGEPCGGEVHPEPGSKAMWLTVEEWETRMQTVEPMPAIPYIFEAVKNGYSVNPTSMYFIDRRAEKPQRQSL